MSSVGSALGTTNVPEKTAILFMATVLIFLSVLPFSDFQSQYLRQQETHHQARRTATKSEESARLNHLKTFLQNSWRELDEKCINITEHNETCIQKFDNVYLGAGSLINKKDKQITLATHCGADKASNLLIQTDWWAGPISVAIYIRKAEDVDKLITFIKERGDALNLSKVHVMMESFHGEVYEGYPHNRLRNLALGAVTTEYVLLMDVDFITNPGSHDKLMDLIYDNKSNGVTSMHDKLHSKEVFALPAFDVLPLAGETANASLLPKSKQEVVNGVNNGTIVPFYEKTCKEAHQFYKYETWLEGGTEEQKNNEGYYEVPFIPYSEPYVMALTEGLPKYHEAFRGYGFDKQSYYYNLDRVGYKFNVLEDFYVAHLHHPTASDEEKREGLRRNFDAWLSYCNCTVNWTPK